MLETTIAHLLPLLTREPGRPRITWYGDGGERVELSGAVLENWVNKTANLLVEEFESGPSSRVRIDLPGHWRTVVWAFATWRVGACVVVGEGSADVVVTDRPDQTPSGADVVAVSLAALARRYAGVLPPSALDAATAVMTYGDQLGWTAPFDPSAPALVDRAGTTSHAALGDHPAVAAPAAAARTVLVADDDRDSMDTVLRTLGVLAAGGSVVLLSAATGAALEADPARRDALLASEQVTQEPGPARQ